MNLNLDKLETGDIILFKGNSWISRIIEYFGKSSYSHVGMVLKNPSFLNSKLKDGIYIIESSYNNTPDAEDGKYKLGVQIHLLEDVLKEFNRGSVFVRHINVKRDEEFYKKLNEIHKEIHDKSYDLNPYDWLIAKLNMYHLFQENESYRKTKSFWCSALLSYIYCELGIIQNDINWSIISPKEFGENTNTIIKFNYPIDKEINIF